MLVQRVTQLFDPGLVFLLSTFIVKSISEREESLLRGLPRVPHNIAGRNSILYQAYTGSAVTLSA